MIFRHQCAKSRDDGQVSVTHFADSAALLAALHIDRIRLLAYRSARGCMDDGRVQERRASPSRIKTTTVFLPCIPLIPHRPDHGQFPVRLDSSTFFEERS
jgi:hypothetical protein